MRTDPSRLRSEFKITYRIGQHTCGHALTIIEEPELHDVTSVYDVPEQMRPKNIGGRWIGGVPLAQVPLAFHRYIQIGTIIGWADERHMIWECPGCGEHLSEETVKPITEEQAE